MGGGGPPEASLAFLGGANAKYLAMIEKKWSMILQHPLFANAAWKQPLSMTEEEALPTADTGVLGNVMPVTNDEIRQAASTGKPKSGGGNLFWVKPGYLANPGVPISQRKVQGLVDYHHDDTAGPPCLELVVGIPQKLEARISIGCSRPA